MEVLDNVHSLIQPQLPIQPFPIQPSPPQKWGWGGKGNKKFEGVTYILVGKKYDSNHNVNPSRLTYYCDTKVTVKLTLLVTSFAMHTLKIH